MKVRKIWTIDSDLAERLDHEENASALINKLLRNHYDDPITEKEKLLIQKVNIQEKENQMSFREIEENIKALEESISRYKNKTDPSNREDNIVRNIASEIGREPTEEEIEEYQNSKEYKNIFQFCEVLKRRDIQELMDETAPKDDMGLE